MSDFAIDLSMFDDMDSSDIIDLEALNVEPYFNDSPDPEFPAFAKSSLDPIREEWLQESDGSYVKPLFRRIVSGSGFPYTAATFPRTMAGLSPSKASDMMPRYADLVRMIDYTARSIAVQYAVWDGFSNVARASFDSIAEYVDAYNGGNRAVQADDSDVDSDAFADRYHPPFLYLDRIRPAIARKMWSVSTDGGEDSGSFDRYVSVGSTLEIVSPIAASASYASVFSAGYGTASRTLYGGYLSAFASPSRQERENGTGTYSSSWNASAVAGLGGYFGSENRTWPKNYAFSNASSGFRRVSDVRSALDSVEELSPAGPVSRMSSPVSSNYVFSGVRIPLHLFSRSPWGVSALKPVLHGASAITALADPYYDPVTCTTSVWQDSGVFAPLCWPDADSGEPDYIDVDEGRNAFSMFKGFPVTTPKALPGLQTCFLKQVSAPMIDPDKDTHILVDGALKYNVPGEIHGSSRGFVPAGRELDFSFQSRWVAGRAWISPTYDLMSSYANRLNVSDVCFPLAAASVTVDLNNKWRPELVIDRTAIDMARRVRRHCPSANPFVALAYMSDFLRARSCSVQLVNASESDSELGLSCPKVVRTVKVERKHWSDQTKGLVSYSDAEYSEELEIDYSSVPVLERLFGSWTYRGWQSAGHVGFHEISSPGGVPRGLVYDSFLTSSSRVWYTYATNGLYWLSSLGRRVRPIVFVSGGRCVHTVTTKSMVDVDENDSDSVHNFDLKTTDIVKTTYGGWRLEGSHRGLRLRLKEKSSPWVAELVGGSDVRADASVVGVKVPSMSNVVISRSTTDGSVGGQQPVENETRQGSLMSITLDTGERETTVAMDLGVRLGEYPRTGGAYGEFTYPVDSLGSESVHFMGRAVPDPEDSAIDSTSSETINHVYPKESEQSSSADDPPTHVYGEITSEISVDAMTVIFLDALLMPRVAFRPMDILGLN